MIINLSDDNINEKVQKQKVIELQVIYTVHALLPLFQSWLLLPGFQISLPKHLTLHYNTAQIHPPVIKQKKMGIFNLITLKKKC